ncbi:hypothetical protein ACSDQ9_03130 [Aestuariimicrobium soli]|uniref:hypothetical protein n=1 Tax=Aestuariimicrobium soli TaxID=2035834 RepID=UPI003EBB513F
MPSTADNIVVASSGTIAFNPTAPADRRYAMLVFRTGVVNETLGYYGMVSPDGLHWSDVSDKPLLLDGDVSNLTWDSADDGGALKIGGLESQIYGMPVLVDDTTISMYYAGFNNGHGGAEPGNPDRDNLVGQTGLVTWRRDGFVSMSNASSAGLGDAGEIVTKPITFTGRDLHLNADVHAGGSVKVTVLGADGTPIPGYTSLPVTGDRPDATAKFPGKSLGSLAGQQVSLRFTVMGADLYSYWVA